MDATPSTLAAIRCNAVLNVQQIRRNAKRMCNFFSCRLAGLCRSFLLGIGRLANAQPRGKRRLTHPQVLAPGGDHAQAFFDHVANNGIRDIGTHCCACSFSHPLTAKAM